ncbi:DUF3757 domain-containing protein [Legionella sp. CNM-4043-24]|uniref:DUF3757 domain-containing protein n=1 Tax=Legionella sp. CNM-4043-24 TaxID=3421646 RepID=UPI00403A9BB2
MNRFLTASLLVGALYQPMAVAHQCPDPDNSSLKWGAIPAPWEPNPFSANPVQGEAGTRFVRANVLVAGLGRGAMCTYRNSAGEYSIWWPVLVKIPAKVDYNWIDTQGGFVCTQSLMDCQFYAAE